jgi:hypothetical protein
MATKGASTKSKFLSFHWGCYVRILNYNLLNAKILTCLISDPSWRPPVGVRWSPQV